MLIEVNKLSKKFSRNLSLALHYGFVDSINNIFPVKTNHTKLRKGEFWALQDVSFSLKRGDRLGILGRNGAGKSTLMKLLAGILRPDHGTIKINGSIDQMIELTSGFHPMMTGYQNARLRARLVGISEIEFKKSINAMVEFTELQDAIHTPVKFYSSGMKARLGFAVSTMRKPDILIIDEALAVGDLDFRLRCYEFIADHLKDTALIFVSHSLGHIKRFCNQGMVLDKGRVTYHGDILKSIELYQHAVTSVGDVGQSKGLNPELLAFSLISAEHNVYPIVSFGTKLLLKIIPKNIPKDSIISVQLADDSGRAILEFRSERADKKLDMSMPITCDLGELYLNAGFYLVNIIVYQQDSFTLLSYSPWKKFQAVGNLSGHAPIQPAGKWSQ
ncbi:ABC transporter ATP-binding protein [Methylophaga sp.]|uniref:ABC transporter ATP-binding protein n=1 Tax=Methylophaga sp. TaxID=2024840 RepID=UPI00271A4056|nr:ABC transporter ATP-binding protein [Methylophaga sp.]MDO8828410.1 ABC transporter ATP-binding protein [Methylophaga sp.]